MLLVVAAVATSWSSYQATRWHGEQAESASRTSAIRVDAARQQGLAEAQTEASRLDQEAEAEAAQVREDIQRAGNYVLTVVLYAVALFFAGMSTKIGNRRLQTVMIGAGYVVLIGAIAWIATFPVSISL